MADQFDLVITLGNDGMRTPQDVARALGEIAKRLRANDADEARDSGRIYDVNGNSCGHWSYEHDSSKG